MLLVFRHEVMVLYFFLRKLGLFRDLSQIYEAENQFNRDIIQEKESFAWTQYSGSIWAQQAARKSRLSR